MSSTVDAPPEPPAIDAAAAQASYDKVCASYSAIDDFRMKLLGLLPLATGTGVFALLSGNAGKIDRGDPGIQTAMAGIGALGLMFTLGLFAYELFGIKKCHYLIEAGRGLERELGIRGQFRRRPYDLAGFINEPFASSLVYPISAAAWVFLGTVFLTRIWAGPIAAVVFAVGWLGTFTGTRRLGRSHDLEERILDSLLPGRPIAVRALARRLREASAPEPAADEPDAGEVDTDQPRHDGKRRPSTGQVERAVHRLAVRGELIRAGDRISLADARSAPTADDAPARADEIRRADRGA